MDQLTCPHKNGCFSNTYMNNTYIIYDPLTPQRVTLNGEEYNNLYWIQKKSIYLYDLILTPLSEGVKYNCSNIVGVAFEHVYNLQEDCVFRIPYNTKNYEDVFLGFGNVSNTTMVFKMHFDDKNYIVNSLYRTSWRTIVAGVLLIVFLVVLTVFASRRRQKKNLTVSDSEEGEFLNKAPPSNDVSEIVLNDDKIETGVI